MRGSFQVQGFKVFEKRTNIFLHSIAPALAHIRQDWTSALFVEKSITIQVTYGTRYTAAFLKNRTININVPQRVLLGPAQRRNYLPS